MHWRFGTRCYTSTTPSLGDQVAMPDRPRLCTLCERISLNALTSYTGYPHHASYQALESSAQQCSLCNLLTCALKQCEGVSEVLQQRESSQQISLGACDGGYVGLGIDTNLTDLDIHVGRERYARLQLFAAAGRQSLSRVLTCKTDTNKMILQRDRALSPAGGLVARPILMPTFS
jgi:hypothetical protein